MSNSSMPSGLRRMYWRWRLSMSPQQNLFFGFALYVFVAWLLLCMPFMQTAEVSMLDNLFTVVSAISTTGLATLSVADSYNFGGELVILLLIQIGGIGYMTFTSFLLLSNKRNMLHWRERILNAEFALPEGFDIRRFIRSVIVFTVIAEILGAIALFFVFYSEGMPAFDALWSGIFHSISSFCTAGFSLFNTSFEAYTGHTWLNLIVTLLCIAGALGFIVVVDLWERLRGIRQSITYTTKAIFWVFMGLYLWGALIIWFFEPSVSTLPFYERSLAASFQSMSALSTAGYNSVPMGGLSLSTLVMMFFLMYIGASPSGTGGGMKTTTLTALVAVLWSKLRGREQVSLLGNGIPAARVSVALSVFIFYTALTFLSIFLLTFSENMPLEKIMFEVISAIGTVGLSTGVTGSLTAFGKCVIIFIMFVGRLGVLTFGLALLAQNKATPNSEKEGDLAV